MCKIKEIKGSELSICLEHHELTNKGEETCCRSGRFFGSWVELVEEIGGGVVKVDAGGAVEWVREEEEEEVEKGSVWERTWVWEWREMGKVWVREKVMVRSEARW